MINTEEKNKQSIIEIIRGINWKSIVLCLLCFFMGRVCLFESFYTLAVAYLAVMFHEKMVRRWCSLLCALGILSVGVMNVSVIKYLGVILLITSLREVMQLIKSEFNLRNQMIIVSISMGLIDIMNFFFLEISIYKIIVFVLEIAITLGLMNVLDIAIEVMRENKKVVLNDFQFVSIVFLLSICLCGMIDFYIDVPIVNRIYLKDILVFVITIGIAYMGGTGKGVVASTIISSILVIIGYMPASFIGIYLFAVLIGGLFNYLERLGVVFAMFLGLLLGFALFNDKIIDWTILSAYIIGAVFSLIIPKHYFGMVGWFDDGMEMDESYHLFRVQGIITEKLKRFAIIFDKLGKDFQTIPLKNMKLDMKHMNEIIEEAGESLCKNCSMCEFCWKDYIEDTYRSSYKILHSLEEKGTIQVADIPREFMKACISAESFAYSLSLKLDMFREQCKWQKRFDEARGLISEEFKGIAESVKKLSQNVEGDFYFNKEDENKIKESLCGLGVRVNDIMVLESNGRKQEIHAYCQYRGEADFKEKIVEGVERAIDNSLEIKRYEYDEERKNCHFVITLKKQYAVAVSAYNKAKDGECGDVYSFMELEDGRYLLAVADGMGSGSIAHKESETTIELLESFLEAGFQSEVALKMINSALVLKSDIECYSTVDIGLLDQYTGVIEFIKMGASTSFIVRGDEIITVKASSLPIGILSEVDLVSCKKQLKDGDIVIMVTDGVLENQNDLLENEATFKHFIMEAKANSPEYMAKFLLSKVKNLLAGQDGDDMTIVVARVWKQNE